MEVKRSQETRGPLEHDRSGALDITGGFEFKLNTSGGADFRVTTLSRPGNITIKCRNLHSHNFQHNVDDTIFGNICWHSVLSGAIVGPSLLRIAAILEATGCAGTIFFVGGLFWRHFPSN